MAKVEAAADGHGVVELGDVRRELRAPPRLGAPLGTTIDMRDPDVVERLYVDQGRKVVELAEACGVSTPTILRILRWHGIPVRRRGRPSRAVTHMFERRRLDHERKSPPAALFQKRIAAVIDARLEDEFAFRDALIDLAAIALDYADELPAPKEGR